jgi:hypothetical protein
MYFRIIQALGGRGKQVRNETNRMNNKLTYSSSNVYYLSIVNCLSRDFQRSFEWILVASDIADEPLVQQDPFMGEARVWVSKTTRLSNSCAMQQ